MKKDVKRDMLKRISSKAKEAMGEKRMEGMHESMEEAMGEKGDSMKIIVSADSQEGLEKGLTKAQQLMKMKFGDMGDMDDDYDDKKKMKKDKE